MKLSCVRTCKNEAKLNECVKKNVYQSVVTCIFVSRSFPAGNCMFKVNNRNTRTRCEICSKLTIKTPERR